MSIKFIEGFDQYQGQSAQQLLSSLTSAGYGVTSGLAMADSRKAGGYALELQVATGAAGKSWSSRTNNVKVVLNGVDANSAGHYIAAGVGGNAVYSDDSVNWLPLILGVSSDLYDVRAKGNTWIIVGASSVIARSTDGRNFTRRPTPAAAMRINSVDSDGVNTWIAAGANGANAVVWKSVDDGATWTAVDMTLAGGGSAVNCVRFKNGVWMMGCAAGGIFVSLDTTNWTYYPTPGAFGIVALDADANGMWLASTTNTAANRALLRSINNGATWVDTGITVPTGLIASLKNADGRWLAVGMPSGAQAATTNIGVSDDGVIWEAVTVAGISARLKDIAALPAPRSGFATVGDVGTGSTTSNTAAILVSLAPATTVTKTFAAPVGITKFTVGFAHRSNTRGKILSILGVVDMDWPSFITMGGGNGTAIPARNVWYYYEVTIDKTAKTATLYINNTLDMVCPISAEAALKTSFDFQWQSENGAVSRIDDIYFVDTAAPNGELLIDRIGPITIPLRLPTSDAGPNNWVPSSAGSHWSAVGLLPPSSESFIRSATSGAQDLFLSNTALPAGAGSAETPIIAVGVVALAMKGDIDNRQLGLIVGAPGATQKEIIDTTLSVVPEYSYAVFEKAPGNVAWDAANTVSTPFGVAVRP